jgi:hypothetical protein
MFLIVVSYVGWKWWWYISRYYPENHNAGLLNIRLIQRAVQDKKRKNSVRNWLTLNTVSESLVFQFTIQKCKD